MTGRYRNDGPHTICGIGPGETGVASLSVGQQSRHVKAGRLVPIEVDNDRNSGLGVDGPDSGPAPDNNVTGLDGESAPEREDY